MEWTDSIKNRIGTIVDLQKDGNICILKFDNDTTTEVDPYGNRMMMLNKYPPPPLQYRKRK